MEIGKNIAKAMLTVQKSLEGVPKTGQNPHLKTTYATLPDVLDEVLPKCHEAGLIILQRTLEAETPQVLRLETTIVHAESAETISMVTPMPVPQSTAQAYGSALTYARRYALMTVFAMKAEDDDGQIASPMPAPARQQNFPPMPAARAVNNYARNGNGTNGANGHEQEKASVYREGRVYEEPVPVAAPARAGFEEAPSDRQLDLLSQLGYDGNHPRTKAEASQLISRLKAQRVNDNSL